MNDRQEGKLIDLMFRVETDDEFMKSHGIPESKVPACARHISDYIHWLTRHGRNYPNSKARFEAYLSIKGDDDVSSSLRNLYGCILYSHEFTPWPEIQKFPEAIRHRAYSDDVHKAAALSSRDADDDSTDEFGYGYMWIDKDCEDRYDDQNGGV